MLLASKIEAERRISSIKTPVLVVMGEKDHDFPDPRAEARYIADKLKGEVVMIPDSGHHCEADSPEHVGKAICSFLGKVSQVA